MDLRGILQKRHGKQAPKALVRTYGCQMSVSDSEKLRAALRCMGYGFTEELQDADLVLFNTCAVRAHAEEKVFGKVGALKALKQERPGLLVVLCGCMTQRPEVAERVKRSYPFVDLMLGTDAPQLLAQRLCEIFGACGDEFLNFENFDVQQTERDSPFKALVPIMYGCDNFCTYCVVPHVRGRERSRPSEEILQEIRDLLAKGYKEITLLGQNVNSYGKNLSEIIDFPELLRKIDALDEDFFLRFMTSHPKDAGPELIDTMAQGKHICRHLHLPVQCGSDRILRQMNRRYTREKYLETANYAQEKMPGLSITSDIIVGFPGETREDFAETLELVQKVGFSSLFTFIFSPRDGTPAANMPDPVPRQEKLLWFQELLALQSEVTKRYAAGFVGKTKQVLLEGKGRKPGTLFAKTSENLLVVVPGDERQVGQFLQVKIDKARGSTLFGVPLA